MKEISLPNGWNIFAINDDETKFLYNEIFTDGVYEKYNFHLGSDPVILDVGANIGLFALYLKERYPTSTVYCLEPAPLCLEALRRNVAAQGDRVHVIEAAVGASPGVTQFTYYPNHTIISGLMADADRDHHALVTSIQADYELRTGKPLELRMAEMLLNDKLDDPVRFDCRVTTLSTVLEEHEISRVALVKIDVECAENFVLDGIEDRHWPRFDNFLIEVHDQGGDEPELMRRRLESKGFDASLFAEPNLAKSGIYAMVATRKGL